MTSSPKYTASAILAVYNSESTIVACLDSLVRQTVPVEIIIVDDGSTDMTKSLIDNFIADFKSPSTFRFLQQSHLGPAVARNSGAKLANSDILIFVDADMTFAREYIADLIMPIIKKGIIGTYTVEERVANPDLLWSRCWNIQEGWEKGKRFPQNPPEYGTDFRAIQRQEFERVRGFENTGYTDTWSLFSKLGVRPLRTYAVCYHKNPDSLTAVYRQAKWSAKRPYKLGLPGTIYALLRSTVPVSLVVGIYKSTVHVTPGFLIFKLVYDWGRFVGILDMLILGNLTK